MSGIGEWATPAEAGKAAGLTAKRVRDLAAEARIRAVKLGPRTWLIYLPSLLQYAARMAELGTHKHDPWRSDLPEGRGRRRTGEEAEE